MLYIVFAVVMLLSFWVVSVYNNLVRLKNSANEVYLAVQNGNVDLKAHYNRVAKRYNEKIEQFPSSFVARLFGFKRKSVFEDL